MLKKLINLVEYLPTIGESVHLVGDEHNGTTVLNSSALHGQQIVVALPLAVLEGNSDRMTGPYVFIVYVLEKALSVSGTPGQTRSQYLGCVRQLEGILGRMVTDLTGARSDDPCPLLVEFDLQGVQVSPEAGVFGGWNGYSATITLR